MSTRKPSDCFFVPAKFKLGLFHVDRYDNIRKGTVTVDGGFPSCRFRGGDWTDIGLFKQLSGFRPTNQTDKEAEITKMVTGAVMEYDNVALGGFTLVSWGMELYCGSKYRYMGVVLRDPRGWNVEMEAADFWKMLMKDGVSMDESKTLCGVKLIYSWSPYGTFMLKDSESDEIRNAFDDGYFESMKSEMRKNVIDRSELKEGTVYNLVTSVKSGIVTTERAVYVGKYSLHSPSDFKDIRFMQYISNPLEYKNGLRGRMAHFYAYPWENSNWKDKVAEFDNGCRERHVFLVLRDRYTQSYPLFYNEFLDHYAGNGHDDYALSVDSLVMLDSVKNKVVGVSDDQTIAPSDDELSANHQRHFQIIPKIPPSGYRIGGYKGYTIDEVKKALNGYERYITDTVKSAVENFPFEKPASVKDWLRSDPTNVREEAVA